ENPSRVSSEILDFTETVFTESQKDLPKDSHRKEEVSSDLNSSSCPNKETGRKIPDNIDEWLIQNKIIKQNNTNKGKHNPSTKTNTKREKRKLNNDNKQFIEIDLLYGDVERLLILLKFCYPQLSEISEEELRDEI